ncbi:MAG: choice-of-anchor A family protein [Ruminococcaceae bacterium]|nr:choice-of-anchor A family protein [Oscillospiraceae bacterium]
MDIKKTIKKLIDVLPLVKQKISEWKYICCIFIVTAVSFFAIYEFAESVALRETDTVDTGESIILDSEGALSDSRIEGVTDILQLSEELAALGSTHSEWTNIKEDKSQTGFFCIAEDKASECVYNIEQNDICKDGYSLKDFDYIWVDSFSGSFYTVINISGRVVDFSDYYILVRDSSANLASRLLINCYEAEEILLKDTILTGTLIAPNAHVTYDNTVVNGQVYAASSSGLRSAYRDIVFSGYYKMMSALKKADLKNDGIRKTALAYLKAKFPLVYGNLPNDYVLGETDLLRVKNLELSGLNLGDITSDLKYFEKLEYFSCANCKVENVDFSGFKQLRKVNFMGSVIKKCTFGKLKSLLQLQADGSMIDNLDVSGCKELVSLSMEGASIKQFVLPENSKIIYFSAAESNFKGFDTKHIASLQNLLYLDLRNNPWLGDIDLSVFPTLKKVDITNCGIKTLSFEKCPALYFAKCSHNAFTKIDISNSPALLYFEAYSDVLEEVEATGLFKRGFAAMYVYDRVKVIDNDPPETPPSAQLPDGTPGVTETPGASNSPSATLTPDSTESTETPDATDAPAESEKPETPEPDKTESPSETEKPKPTDTPEETDAPETSVPETATPETSESESVPTETVAPEHTESAEELSDIEE